MEADWSVALGADDPVVAVPWAASQQEGGSRFVDLRGKPHLVDGIPEAESNPPLREALIMLNREDSPVWTAKCDRWATSDEPRDPYEMDAEPEQTAFCCGSYIDIVGHDARFRQSFSRQEQWLRFVTRQLRAIAARASRVDLVLRAAEVEGQSCFAVSWFVEACGASAAMAEQQWANTLTLSLPVIMESLQTTGGERYNERTGE